MKSVSSVANAPSKTPSGVRPATTPERSLGATGWHDKLTEVRRGQRWEESLEVEGEAEFRPSFQRIFTALNRPEGGVTFQDARLIPLKRPLVGVQIMGETVGYLDGDEDFFVEETVLRSLARISKGEVAVIHARLWARNDNGVWRARVTLEHGIGEGERERDYRADRIAQEQRDAERATAEHEQAVAREARETERAAKRRLEAEAVEAGSVDGRHWSDRQLEVSALKTEGRLDEAAALLTRLVDSAEAEAKVRGVLPAQWPTTQLAMIYRQQGATTDELALFERYARIANSEPLPKRIASNLQRARLNAQVTDDAGHGQD